MSTKMTDEANAIMRNPRGFLAGVRAGNQPTTLNNKFQIENFDLIVWEYITK